MADPELEAIRQRRLQELQSQYGNKPAGGPMNMVILGMFDSFSNCCFF